VIVADNHHIMATGWGAVSYVGAWTHVRREDSDFVRELHFPDAWGWIRLRGAQVASPTHPLSSFPGHFRPALHDFCALMNSAVDTLRY
jgi:hypothetical protein